MPCGCLGSAAPPNYNNNNNFSAVGAGAGGGVNNYNANNCGGLFAGFYGNYGVKWSNRAEAQVKATTFGKRRRRLGGNP